jgi:uncharacterized protein YjbJ (UPF0337 family)
MKRPKRGAPFNAAAKGMRFADGLSRQRPSPQCDGVQSAERNSLFAMGDTAMNWDQVQGNWRQLKGKVQQKWGKLTSDDLDVIDGRRSELVGKIQERYGSARDVAEREVKDFCDSCH